MYKCWHNLGNTDYSIGNINSKDLYIDEKILTRFIISTDPFNDINCKACNLLPICWGGCPMERYENKYNNGMNNMCTHFKDNLTSFGSTTIFVGNF